MVKSHVFLVVMFVGLVYISSISGVDAQRQYSFGQEWTEVWINQNGSIDLFYNISITLDVGENINWISVGQPQGDFSIGSAIDQYGNTLITADASSGSDYKVRVNLYSPLESGQTIWFTLITNVAHMIYEYETNPRNDGMKFTAAWFSDAIIEDLRLLIVLPAGISESEVKTGAIFWSNVQYENERLAITLCNEEADFTKIKQILDYLFSQLDLKYEIKDVEHDSFIEGRVGRVSVNGKDVAYIGEVHPKVLKNFDLNMPVGALELNLSELFELKK